MNTRPGQPAYGTYQAAAQFAPPHDTPEVSGLLLLEQHFRYPGKLTDDHQLLVPVLGCVAARPLYRGNREVYDELVGLEATHLKLYPDPGISEAAKLTRIGKADVQSPLWLAADGYGKTLGSTYFTLGVIRYFRTWMLEPGNSVSLPGMYRLPVKHVAVRQPLRKRTQVAYREGLYGEEPPRPTDVRLYFFGS